MKNARFEDKKLNEMPIKGGVSLRHNNWYKTWL